MIPIVIEPRVSDYHLPLIAMDEDLKIVDRRAYREIAPLLAKLKRPIGRVWQMGENEVITTRFSWLSAPPADHYFFATFKGAPVGMGWVSINVLYRMATIGHGVFPDYRGQGLGTDIRIMMFKALLRLLPKLDWIDGHCFHHNAEAFLTKGCEKHGGRWHQIRPDPAGTTMIPPSMVWARGAKVLRYTFRITSPEIPLLPSSRVVIRPISRSEAENSWPFLWTHRPDWMLPAYPRRELIVSGPGVYLAEVAPYRFSSMIDLEKIDNRTAQSLWDRSLQGIDAEASFGPECPTVRPRGEETCFKIALAGDVLGILGWERTGETIKWWASLLPEHRGSNWINLILSEVMRKAFTEERVKELVTEIYGSNPASLPSALSSSWLTAWAAIPNAVMVHGVPTTRHLFGITRDEWVKRVRV